MSTVLVSPHEARASHRDLMALARFWEWERAVDHELARGIDAIDIDTLFQPIYRIRDGIPAARGFEAVSRFPLAPRIPPRMWFLGAREKGLVTELELAAIRSAFTSAGKLHPEAFLCVNASPDALSHLFESIPPELQGRVIVDLHYATVRGEGLGARFELLRHRGAGVAIEVGVDEIASCAGDLIEMAPDCIKVDLATAPDDATPSPEQLAHAVNWSASAGITLMADRVEHEEELALLQSVGVEWAQGHHLSSPIDL